MGETNVGGQKHVKGFIYVGKVRVHLLKNPTKGLKAGRDTALALSIDGRNDSQLVNQRAVDEV